MQDGQVIAIGRRGADNHVSQPFQVPWIPGGISGVGPVAKTSFSLAGVKLGVGRDGMLAGQRARRRVINADVVGSHGRCRQGIGGQQEMDVQIHVPRGVGDHLVRLPFEAAVGPRGVGGRVEKPIGRGGGRDLIPDDHIVPLDHHHMAHGSLAVGSVSHGLIGNVRRTEGLENAADRAEVLVPYSGMTQRTVLWAMV